MLFSCHVILASIWPPQEHQDCLNQVAGQYLKPKGTHLSLLETYLAASPFAAICLGLPWSSAVAQGPQVVLSSLLCGRSRSLEAQLWSLTLWLDSPSANHEVKTSVLVFCLRNCPKGRLVGKQGIRQEKQRS